MEFTQNASNNTNTLEAAYHSEGRVVANGNKWEYNLKDHLGNVRLVFTESNGLASIVQDNHYYPFGMQQNGNWAKTQTVKNDYLYNGKELNKEIGLNWSDYGARFYDASIGRFVEIDPMADSYIRINHYAYVANNPLRYIDPDGRNLLDYVAGTIIGVATNVIPGSTGLRNQYTPTDAAHYNTALSTLDNSAQAGGALLTINGGNKLVAGGLIAAAGGAQLAMPTGVTQVTGSATATAGGALATQDAVEAGAGLILMSNSDNNQAAGL